jgi:hypothetical protein
LQTDHSGDSASPYVVTESGIYIDISSVPALDGVEAEEFSQLLTVLKNKISTDDLLHEVAVHEAGHIIQFALQGINRMNLYGPTIRYRRPETLRPESEASRFFGFPAAMKETKTARQVMSDVAGVKLLTKRCVSGGVATYIVFNREFEDLEDEMSDDYHQFEKLCDDAESAAMKSRNPFTIERQSLWSATLRAVTKTYRSRPSIRTEILTVAEQVKEAIRSWRAEQPIPISCDLGPT